MFSEKVKKRLYAVLWVDDYGSLPLRPKDIAWYHQNAGPMSLSLERDDQYPWSFAKVLKPGGRKIPSPDYLSHHYHPIRWKGAAIPKKIYDSLQLYWIVWSGLKSLPFLPSKTLFRIGLFSALAGLLGLISCVYLVNPLISALLILPYSLGAALIAVWYYVRHPRNWEYPISDRDWNKGFLLKAKSEFEKRGHAYPAVIRHGWNLPWQDSMGFYMEKLGVLADASSVPRGVNGHPAIGGRGIEWLIPTPYYASLKGDYNIPWDGEDEGDRGIVELPVNLGNIEAYGFGPEERERIANTPQGGLVSVYIHPEDGFSAVKEWVKYLKENYDVRFVTAEEYAAIFMKRNPRPVIIDKDLRVKWASMRDGEFYPIREVARDIISLEILDKGQGFAEVLLRVDTENPVPVICILSADVQVREKGLSLDSKEGKALLRAVKPGAYKIRIATSLGEL